MPSAEQLAVWPEGVSGNDINGLGEPASRPPTPIMWHDPAMLAHGELQTWFWAQGSRIPEIAERRAARQRLIDAELCPARGLVAQGEILAYIVMIPI